MRLGPKIISAAAVILAALFCWLAAVTAADIIEDRSGKAVSIALIEQGHDWADVHTDGLQVHIGGIAPSEAKRFNALHVAGTMVDATRIVDGTTVQPSEPLAPPRYSMEILRNDEGVTLIGLIPDTQDRAAMVNEIMSLAQGSEVTDLLQAAHYPTPEGWEVAVHYGLNALARLPRSKISISAGKIEITAIAESEEQKLEMEQAIEAALRRRSNLGLEVDYRISAPRPVITPFTLRFLIDENGPHFDACSADTAHTRERILSAASEAGLEGEVDCTLGLGVPSTDWAEAVIQGIRAVAEFEGGSVTFSDADVTLVALETTPQALFDRIVGELESNLPDVFSLHSVLPEPVVMDGAGEGDGPPEFTATRSPEGQVQLRGRLNNDMVRSTVESFAKARFGVDNVYTAARIDEELPDEWPVRVLAGLQALSELDSGSAMIQEDFIALRGKTGSKAARPEIARILGEKLGDNQHYKIDVVYEEALDPIAAMPTPEECVANVNDLLSETKITFEPGSADISGSAVGVINDIADILKECREVEMEIEIAGHTDSQGREEMNLELSQGRAQAVLDALVARRVLTSGIDAKGYGESNPIADNDTEEGREANRRIEFLLLTDAEVDDAMDENGAEGTGEGAEAAETAPAQGTDSDATAEETTDPSASEEALDATTGAAVAPENESDTAETGTEENQ
ncbi:OmpA family protein [Aliiruegeria lutimaris]|uniref:OmpA-OmpF porin, OOP family n=1 Tax=Aliiruegeria lutimaris TaxID=571298 RepID=A0A1G9BQ90_9RHOB|nr:OmpA family protein [Aliiruegeria lutimaris]SDK41642.1 OmpA-OmpF porin, OOP family [Aliiruegeria lutimaris]